MATCNLRLVRPHQPSNRTFGTSSRWRSQPATAFLVEEESGAYRPRVSHEPGQLACLRTSSDVRPWADLQPDGGQSALVVCRGLDRGVMYRDERLPRNGVAGTMAQVMVMVMEMVVLMGWLRRNWAVSLRRDGLVSGRPAHGSLSPAPLQARYISRTVPQSVIRVRVLVFISKRWRSCSCELPFVRFWPTHPRNYIFPCPAKPVCWGVVAWPPSIRCTGIPWERGRQQH